MERFLNERFLNGMVPKQGGRKGRGGEGAGGGSQKLGVRAYQLIEL